MNTWSDETEEIKILWTANYNLHDWQLRPLIEYVINSYVLAASVNNSLISWLGSDTISRNNKNNELPRPIYESCDNPP